MFSIGWIIFYVYMVGYISTWRTVVWAMMNDVVSETRIRTGKIDNDDVGFGMIFGTLLNFFWPLFLIYFLIRKAIKKILSSLRVKEFWTLLIPRHKKREMFPKESDYTYDA